MAAGKQHSGDQLSPGDRPQAGSGSKKEVSFFTILASVFASFFGVQNHKNRKRDFESGKFWHFFAAGLIFVLLFLLAVWGAVQYLLATTPTGQ